MIQWPDGGAAEVFRLRRYLEVGTDRAQSTLSATETVVPGTDPACRHRDKERGCQPPLSCRLFHNYFGPNPRLTRIMDAAERLNLVAGKAQFARHKSLFCQFLIWAMP
jgi:hypothetical protein